jgi:branched-chain amino acid aminotransferase
MAFKYFFHNSQLLPIEQAVIPLSSIEYSYGYGVYESIRVSKGTIFFLEEHARRLINSARIIQLEHSLNEEQVAGSVQKLVKANEASSCNVKILLIGGDSKDSANFYIQCLNPLFPTKELQREGTRCITYRYERAWPGAKTLNMLPSYLAYRQAKAASAYDALLVDSQDCLREGPRTNLLAFQGNT